VTDAAWPDFDEGELARALASYARRERRFGKTGAQVRGEMAPAASSTAPSSSKSSSAELACKAGEATSESEAEAASEAATLAAALAAAKAAATALRAEPSLLPAVSAGYFAGEGGAPTAAILEAAGSVARARVAAVLGAASAARVTAHAARRAARWCPTAWRPALATEAGRGVRGNLVLRAARACLVWGAVPTVILALALLALLVALPSVLRLGLAIERVHCTIERTAPAAGQGVVSGASGAVPLACEEDGALSACGAAASAGACAAAVSPDGASATTISLAAPSLATPLLDASGRPAPLSVVFAKAARWTAAVLWGAESRAGGALADEE
jgi:trimeric autotransporter adhesin